MNIKKYLHLSLVLVLGLILSGCAQMQSQIKMKDKKLKMQLNCPMPKLDYDIITLGHGSGGVLTNRSLNDGVFSVLNGDRPTNSFPLFFKITVLETTVETFNLVLISSRYSFGYFINYLIIP